jgi:hypothetical protein
VATFFRGERVAEMNDLKGNVGEGRDRKNGQYAATLDRVCVCGHTLGQHTAASCGGERPCLECEPDCMKFRTSKKKAAPKKAPTFCADIRVPNGHKGSRIVMTGAWTDTPEESLSKGLESARYYVEDQNGPNYAWADTVVHCLCGECGGTGRNQTVRRGRRVPYSFKACEACLHEGILYSLIPVRTKGPLAHLLTADSDYRGVGVSS